MGREISRLEFSAQTRREMQSRPVSSRFFQSRNCLEVGIFEIVNVSTCLDVHPLQAQVLKHFSILSCISRSRLVLAKFCLDPSGWDCKFENYVFLAPKSFIELKWAKLGQLFAIFAPILPIIGLKCHCLDSFLGETRREISSRPVSSRKLDVWEVSSCLGSVISVSKWVLIQGFLSTLSLE